MIKFILWCMAFYIAAINPTMFAGLYVYYMSTG